MRSITFTVYFSTGSSGRFYSSCILIDKPQISISFYFDAEDLFLLGIKTLNQLIHEVKTANRCVEELITAEGVENFTIHSTYIKQEDHLLSFEQDKVLDDLFADFSSSHLELLHFHIAGGASIQCNGYTFKVWPNENGHRHLPHVHVIRDCKSVRYSLIDLKRLDECDRIYLRDEKKKIIPALKRHLDTLRKFWIASMGGYRPPEFDLNGKQYYPES